MDLKYQKKLMLLNYNTHLVAKSVFDNTFPNEQFYVENLLLNNFSVYLLHNFRSKNLIYTLSGKGESGYF